MVRHPFLLTGIRLSSYKQEQKETRLTRTITVICFEKNKQTNKQKQIVRTRVCQSKKKKNRELTANSTHFFGRRPHIKL